MKICFFDDEPELYPLQYGGKARTIVNLANEFIKHPDVSEVKILSRSIRSDKKVIFKNKVKYIALDDNNTFEMIARECQNSDIINIHCCSFTFPRFKSKAKKFYFLHDVLIATADRGSHLDKALGGDFDYVLAPSTFAKSIYDAKKKLLNIKTDCLVIPRHIDLDLFSDFEINNVSDYPDFLRDICSKYTYIFFFPCRPIPEKGGKYVKQFAESIKSKNNACIIGPFGDDASFPDNCINTGWIESDKLKYYYSIADVTFNFSTLPESFSQICIESICCKTPVVAFDSGNIGKLSELTDGILICERNIDSIIEKTKKAVCLKKESFNMDIEKKKIIAEFNENKIVNQYIDLYKRVLEEKNENE